MVKSKGIKADFMFGLWGMNYTKYKKRHEQNCKITSGLFVLSIGIYSRYQSRSTQLQFVFGRSYFWS
jgi:hypothetical protein